MGKWNPKRRQVQSPFPTRRSQEAATAALTGFAPTQAAAEKWIQEIVTAAAAAYLNNEFRLVTI